MRKKLAEDFHLTASFMSVRVRSDEHKKQKSHGSLPWVTRILKARVSRCLLHLMVLFVLCLQRYLEPQSGSQEYFYLLWALLPCCMANT